MWAIKQSKQNDGFLNVFFLCVTYRTMPSDQEQDDINDSQLDLHEITNDFDNEIASITGIFHAFETLCNIAALHGFNLNEHENNNNPK